MRGWLTLVCAGTLAVVSCGGKGQESGRSGGTIRVSHTAFPDALDPALASTQSALQTLRTVYTPLLSYAYADGADGAKVVPGLAEKLPEVSLDGRTYLLKLHEKLRYSDGTPVHASDFEHAIRRVLRLKSPGASYFLDILGADEYVKAGQPDGDISGIATSDRTNDLTITLKQPNARFREVLALEYGALVPGDTPFADQTKTPPAGVGPYRLGTVRAGRGYELVRVPGFDLAGLPAGKLDRLVVSAGAGAPSSPPADYTADPPATTTTGTRITQPVKPATLLFGARTLSGAFSDRIDTQNCLQWHPVFSLDLARLCVK
jgi:peptide/nickel transport system substrate-binding protein